MNGCRDSGPLQIVLDLAIDDLNLVMRPLIAITLWMGEILQGGGGLKNFLI